MPVPAFIGAALATPAGKFLAGALVSLALGAGSKAGELIVDKIKRAKQAKKSGKPNVKDYPKGTSIVENGKGSYNISEPGKPTYLYTPEQAPKSPIVFSDDELKLIDPLPPKERELVDNIINMMQEDPSFMDTIENIDISSLQELAQGKLPSAEELGFPPNTNVIDQLFKDTEFAPIEEAARRQFHGNTLPGIASQFAGAGQLNTSALLGQLGRAGSDLESKLAALKSQYGLERAQTLGGLSQKQQALDVGRAQAIGNLGLAQQGQQFGQQHDIANLGLQQNQQQLSDQQIKANLLSSLLSQGQYTAAGVPGSASKPSFSDYAFGIAGKLGGLAGQSYMKQSADNSLLEQMKLLGKQ